MRALRRTTRIFLAAGWCAALVLSGLALTLHLAFRPGEIEGRVRRALAAAFVGPVRFSDFRFSWLTGVELRDVRVECPRPKAGGDSGSPESFCLESLRVVPRLSGLFRGRLEVIRVYAKAAEVSLRHDSEGRWNLLEALRPELREALLKPHRRIGPWPAVRLDIGHAKFEEAAFSDERSALELEDLTLRLRPGAPDEVLFFAKMGTAALEGFAAIGTAGERPYGKGTFSLRRANLSALGVWLPKGLSRLLGDSKFDGSMDVAVHWELSWDGALCVRGGSGKLARGVFSSPLLPQPVTGVEGEFRLGNDRIECTGLRGNLGRSSISIAGRIEVPGGLAFPGARFDEATWGLELKAGSLLIEPRIRDFLPSALRDFYDRYSPEGAIDLELAINGSLARPPQLEDLKASVRFANGSIAHEEFPYRVRGMKGCVMIDGGRFYFPEPIEARDGPFVGSLLGPGGDIRKCGEADVTIELRSVPLGEAFRAALPEDLREAWDDLRLAGSADAEIRVKRPPPADGYGRDPSRPCAPTQVRILAVPKGLRICHRRFPYEVAGIEGKIEIDLDEKRVRFEGLRGRHGSAEIFADGVLEYGAPYQLSLAFSSGALELDEELRRALPPSTAEALRDFGLEGTLRVSVQLRGDHPAGSQVTGEASIVRARLCPPRFPYALELADGVVKIDAEGSVAWSGVSTPAGSKPYIVLGGRLSRRGSLRELTLELDFDALEFDDRIRDALPPHLERATSNMGLGGVFAGRVEVIRRTDEARPGWAEVLYSGKNVKVRSGSLDFGLKIRELEAIGNFSGDASGSNGIAEGRVEVESGRFNRLRLSRGRVDFALGKPFAASGLTASAAAAVRERASAVAPGDLLQFSIRSELYGGELQGWLFLDVGDGAEFGGEFSAKDVQVARAARDVFETTVRRSSGRASARVSFLGKNRDQRSISGEGQCRVEDARLVEVPVFLDFGRLLFGEPAGSGHFREVRAVFRIEDGKFLADPPAGVEILSPNLKLAGGGTMDFRGNLDLLLDTQILGFRIPLVDEVLSLLKKGLARISVVGDISKPKVELVTGAGILRVGFPEGETEKK